MTVPGDGRMESLPDSRSGWMRAPATRKVMAALTTSGETVRFVGGCVRDSLLGRPIADIDIATTMVPQTVMQGVTAAGLKAIPTGIDHGTVTVVADGQPFEVTTLRRDVATDGRHAVVAFTEDWKQDAARRDFTINALSADQDGRLFDYFGGVADARAGRIRFVGDPIRRIEEDVLRLLRFFRFYAQFGRPPADHAALKACAAMAGRIGSLSGERVRVEVLKLLATADPMESWRLMIETGVAAHTIGEPGDIGRLAGLMSVESECGTGAEPVRRLAALLTGGLAAATALADRLRMSRAERDRLAALADHGQCVAADTEPAVLRRMIYRLGGATAFDRILLAWAREPGEERFKSMVRLAEEWSPPKFPLKGRDAMAQGLSAGPAVGDLLAAIEADWIAGDFQSDRKALLTELKRRIAGGSPPV